MSYTNTGVKWSRKHRLWEAYVFYKGKKLTVDYFRKEHLALHAARDYYRTLSRLEK